jgi:very-short-patch-repair endonuclease
MTLPHIDSWIWLVVAILGGAALLGIVSGLAGRVGKSQLPYERQQSLLTPAELAFFKVLQQAVGTGIQIAPKVRLADLIAVRKGTEQFYTHFNKISAKHVDFVLCDLQDYAPLLVIELDDSSHRGESAQDRDDFKNQALGAAQVPILRFRASRSYQVAEVRQAVDQALHGSVAHERQLR